MPDLSTTSEPQACCAPGARVNRCSRRRPFTPGPPLEFHLSNGTRASSCRSTGEPHRHRYELREMRSSRDAWSAPRAVRERRHSSTALRAARTGYRAGATRCEPLRIRQATQEGLFGTSRVAAARAARALQRAGSTARRLCCRNRCAAVARARISASRKRGERTRARNRRD